MPEITPHILAAADKVDRDLDALDMSTRTLLSLLRAGDTQPPGGGGGPTLPDGWRVRTATRDWSNASQVIDYPDGTTTGDFMLLAWVSAYDQSGRDPGTPSGWTSRFAVNYIGHHRVYSRVAGAETSVTIPATTTETDIVFAILSTSSGASYNTGSPFALTGQNTTTDGSASATTPQPNRANKQLVLFSSMNEAVTAISSVDARLTEFANIKHPASPASSSIRRPWLYLGFEDIVGTGLASGYSITWDANTYKMAARLTFAAP